MDIIFEKGFLACFLLGVIVLSRAVVSEDIVERKYAVIIGIALFIMGLILGITKW